MCGIANLLAKWARDLSLESIPEDVALLIKERIMDVTGCRLAGGGTAFSSQLSIALKGPSGRLQSDGAMAFFHSAVSSCLDFDDTHNETLIHPTASVLFAALAAARIVPCDGQRLLTAVTAGVEIACRIASATPGAFHAQGFHPTGVVTVFGAAAAASLVMDADARTIEHALGLAGSFASGLLQPFVEGTDQRYLHGGTAAASGLLSARLATAGISGAEQILEGPSGLWMTYVPSVSPSLEDVEGELGQRWACRGVSLKRYPTGFVTHPFIDAMLLSVRDIWQAEGIEEMVCVVPENAARLVCEPRSEKILPRTSTMARISLPHMLAEALVYGKIDKNAFLPDRLLDYRVNGIAKRIIHKIAQTGEVPAIDLRTNSGITRRFELTARPLLPGEVIEKFRSNCDGIIDVEAQNAFLFAIGKLELQANAWGPFSPLLDD